MRVLKRPAVLAAALYAVLAVLFVSPALMPGKTLSASDYLWSLPPWHEMQPSSVGPLGANWEQLDNTLQYSLYRNYTREQGEVPLWNPHIMGGRPFLGNGQSAVFSTFSAPAYVVEPSREHAWAVALKIFVAAFGMYLLAQALRLRFAASLMAGVVYAFGFFFVSYLAWVLTDVWAWFPWVLLMTELVVRRPEPLPVAGLSVVTALQFFGGHPESSFHVVFAALLFFVLRLVVRRRELPEGERPLARPILAFAGALALGGLLAAIALIPLGETILNSNELTARTDRLPDRVPPRFLLGLLLPDYWGRATQELLVPFIQWRAFYVGALGLMLACAAVVLRPNLERLAVAGFGLGALATVTGIPPFHQVVHALPGFSASHNSRLIIYWLIAAALLAAYGLDELMERRPEGRRARGITLGALALVCFPLVWLAFGRPGPDDALDALKTAWTFVDPPHDPDVIRLASLIVWLSFAGAAALLLILRLRGRLSGRTFGALAVALVVADLFRIGVGLNPAIEKDVATVPANAAIQYLQDRRPGRFVGAEPPAFARHPMQPNIAMYFGLDDARGYDFPVEKRYGKLWRRAVYDGDEIPELTAPINEESMRALNLLAVSDIMVGPDGPFPHEPGLRRVRTGPGWSIYANERALPRVSLVGGSRVVSGEDEALDAVLDPEFDGRKTAILEKPLAGLSTPGKAGEARIVDLEPERVVIDADADRSALLVLADTYYPGWKAEVDDHEVDIERVDYMLRGIPLPAGSHKVEFSYEPVSWRIGWILSAVGLVLLLGLLALGLRRR